MLVHQDFGFGFDHYSCQGFGAAIADYDAAGVLEVLLSGADGGGDGGDRFEGALFADLYVDDDLREDFEICCEVIDGLACPCDKVEDYEGGEQAVACGGEMRKEDVAGLFSAESGVVF